MLSPYLVENASNLYYSFGYDNSRQEIDFMSFSEYLGAMKVPWEAITADGFEKLKAEALDPQSYNKKAKDALFEYALIYYETSIFRRLAELKYRKAEDWEREGFNRMERKFPPFL